MPSTPYNLDYKFGPDLREVPADPASMQAYIDFLIGEVRKLGEPKEGNVRALVKLLGEIGAYGKILKKTEAAKRALEKSLQLIDEPELSPSVWAVHTLRLGDVQRFEGDSLGAETSFRAVLEMAAREPDLKELEDFCWQHLGKLRFDEKRWDESEQFLLKALERRKLKGVAELTASTEQALKTILMKKKNLSGKR